MDIREALLAEHSKAQTLTIVAYIGSDAEKFRELMRYFLGDTYRLSQRAAAAVNYCTERQPQLVQPYFGKLVAQLERDDAHVAVRRIIVRMLQFVDIPKRYLGRVYDACYNLVADPAQPVAVKAFALTTAARVADGSPELLAELRLLATTQLPHTTIGFRRRAENVLGVRSKP